MKDIQFNIIKSISCKRTNSFLLLLLVIILITQISCRKLVEIPPPSASVAENNVYTTDGTAIGVLTGIYISMLGSPASLFSGRSSIAVRTGLGSDELTLFGGVTADVTRRYYRNELAENGLISAGSDYWAPFYNYIFKCNAAIEGLTKSNSLTPSVKQQLLGEAKFMRAFFFFYLTNLFGDVPLSLSTDPKINSLLSRASQSNVYNQIKNDLKDAQELLSSNYIDITLLENTSERVRPTKWAATALLARVYLYTNDYTNAEIHSTFVINNVSLYSLPRLDSVFLKNSNETIWQIQPTVTGFNTWDAFTFVLLPTGPGAGADRSFYLNPQLLNAFEPGDQRRFNRNWVDSVIKNGTTYYYTYKYKKGSYDPNLLSTGDLSEYLMVLRLSEQYLIRAEARAHLGSTSGAVSDLNVIRNRAGLTSYGGPTTQAPLLSAIWQERQVELFTEWGHRWFDLKRTNKVDAVMSVVTPLKGGAWQTTDQLYPLPLTELQNAPNLVQNAGY